jgi:hypothetical protein
MRFYALNNEWVMFWVFVSTTVFIPIAIHIRPGRSWSATITAATISTMLLIVFNSLLQGRSDRLYLFLQISFGWYFSFVVACLVRLAFFLIRPRTVEGGCQECGYNLTGNESGVCPECGTAITED